ncbi:hypothetical protein HDU92_004961 [Lobulomyces angularis]|nr:hypothetical protein HDU92_004961 [Lobulomyces angularis]
MNPNNPTNSLNLGNSIDRVKQHQNSYRQQQQHSISPGQSSGLNQASISSWDSKGQNFNRTGNSSQQRQIINQTNRQTYNNHSQLNVRGRDTVNNRYQRNSSNYPDYNRNQIYPPEHFTGGSNLKRNSPIRQSQQLFTNNNSNKINMSRSSKINQHGLLNNSRFYNRNYQNNRYNNDIKPPGQRSSLIQKDYSLAKPREFMLSKEDKEDENTNISEEKEEDPPEESESEEEGLDIIECLDEMEKIDAEITLNENKLKQRRAQIKLKEQLALEQVVLTEDNLLEEKILDISDSKMETEDPNLNLGNDELKLNHFTFKKDVDGMEVFVGVISDVDLLKLNDQGEAETGLIEQHTDLINKIYRENRANVKKNCMSLTKYQQKLSLKPLFSSSFEDLPFFKTNIEKFQIIKPYIFQSIRRRILGVQKKKIKLLNQYKNYFNEWKVRAKKLELKQSQNYHKFMKKQRGLHGNLRQGNSIQNNFLPGGSEFLPNYYQQNNRGSRRGGLNTTDAVRSEAELESVLAMLAKENIDGDNERIAKNIPMAIDIYEKQALSYKDYNNLLPDTEGELNEYNSNAMIKWSKYEKELFLQKFLEFGKRFPKIAQYLPNKTSSDCIEYYYREKMNIGLKQLAKKHQQSQNKVGRRKGSQKKTKPVLLEHTSFPEEDVEEDVEEEDSTKKKKKEKNLASKTLGKYKSKADAEESEEDEGRGETAFDKSAGRQSLSVSDPKSLGKRTPRQVASIKSTNTETIANWSGDEKVKVCQAFELYGKNYETIAKVIGNGKKGEDIRLFYNKYKKTLNLQENVRKFDAKRKLEIVDNAIDGLGLKDTEKKIKRVKLDQNDLKDETAQDASIDVDESFIKNIAVGNEVNVTPISSTSEFFNQSQTLFPQPDSSQVRKTVSYWSVEEKKQFLLEFTKYGKNWDEISKHITAKSAIQIRNYYQNHKDEIGFDKYFVNSNNSLTGDDENQTDEVVDSRANITNTVEKVKRQYVQRKKRGSVHQTAFTHQQQHLLQQQQNTISTTSSVVGTVSASSTPAREEYGGWSNTFSPSPHHVNQQHIQQVSQVQHSKVNSNTFPPTFPPSSMTKSYYPKSEPSVNLFHQQQAPPQIQQQNPSIQQQIAAQPDYQSVTSSMPVSTPAISQNYYSGNYPTYRPAQNYKEFNSSSNTVNINSAVSSSSTRVQPSATNYFSTSDRRNSASSLNAKKDQVPAWRSGGFSYFTREEAAPRMTQDEFNMNHRLNEEFPKSTPNSNYYTASGSLFTPSTNESYRQHQVQPQQQQQTQSLQQRESQQQWGADYSYPQQQQKLAPIHNFVQQQFQQHTVRTPTPENVNISQNYASHSQQPVRMHTVDPSFQLAPISQLKQIISTRRDSTSSPKLPSSMILEKMSNGSSSPKLPNLSVLNKDNNSSPLHYSVEQQGIHGQMSGSSSPVKRLNNRGDETNFDRYPHLDSSASQNNPSAPGSQSNIMLLGGGLGAPGGLGSFDSSGFIKPEINNNLKSNSTLNSISLPSLSNMDYTTSSSSNPQQIVLPSLQNLLNLSKSGENGGGRGNSMNVVREQEVTKEDRRTNND